MAAFPDHLLAGQPYPLGATWDGLGTNFAVFSANADRIDLCLFDPSGRREVKRLALPEFTDEVWHGYLPGVRSGLIYGYRACSYEHLSFSRPSFQSQAAPRSRPSTVGEMRTRPRHFSLFGLIALRS